MNKKKIIKIMLLAGSVGLIACDSTSNEEKTTSTKYITPKVANGQITIDTSTLTEHPLYINYDINGTNIQMIAVKASDGTARLSLNTCQSCNPSPKAYFLEENGKLVCQNCGNVFTMDSVGQASGGCNPMNIAYTIKDNELIVYVSELESYANNFVSWNGPIE